MNISAEHKNRESLAARQLSEMKASGETEALRKSHSGRNSIAASAAGKSGPDSKYSKSRAFQ